jgi:ubiquinone/menaquinone biosynthesis C-methylase UbiE
VPTVELSGMPAMSTLERALCRSLPWRLFTRRVVVPWAIGPTELRGDVLELGSGSGAMAEELLERYPSIRVTATDVDPAMRAAATRRLERFGDRARVQEADATQLPFSDASFDGVVSFIMLHHVIAWEDALAEASRVLRPGGMLAGYDLMRSGPNRLLHRHNGSGHRLATAEALRTRLAELSLTGVTVRPGLGGMVARFRGERADTNPARP